MRWEKLFADLEGIVGDEALTERDALVTELRDGERAATRWQQLAGGGVSLEVAGVGRIDGTVQSGNDQVIHVLTDRAHMLVNPVALMAVLGASQRAEKPTVVSSKLGWPYVFRLLQRDQDRVQVCRTDSTSRAGRVVLVGADFVQIRDEAGNAPMIPYSAIAVVSCSR
ncbi:MAG: hypothetical protein H7288_09395 [Kineosporiaceae bacterium]|nr:hypothetical protein [Aeromicrobium sp.]